MVIATSTGNVASAIGPALQGSAHQTSFNDPSSEAGKEVRRGIATRRRA